MATTSLDELIERARLKANIAESQFVTDPEIVVYLNEAGQELREKIIAADDSYYQATLDFSIGADPLNVQELPDTFWKMRGLDGFATDRLRRREVYAREFRNRFDPGIGYYFGGDGNSIVVCGDYPETANPFRLTYTPKPLPLAPLVDGVTRSVAHNVLDGTNAASLIILMNAGFSAADVGGTITIADSGTPVDGTYTIAAIVDPTAVQVLPAPTPSQVFGVNTTASIASSAEHTRTFAIAPTDNQSSGYWTLQNGSFGPADVGAFIEVVVGNDDYDGTYTIVERVSATVIRVLPAIAGTSGSLTGTATISRQPAGTRNRLDLTEDNFAEYYSVRAGMVIARKKRQDTLVAQLAAERTAIEERITAMSRMRQSEPQQAPILHGRRRAYVDDDLDV